MTRKKSTRDHWLKHYQAFKAEGVTQREYCKANNLGYWTFNKWKREFDQDKLASSFQQLPVKLKSTQTDAFEIILQDNVRIKIPENFSEQTLNKIFSAVRNIQ